ncbi:MAG: hypothetical protein ABJB03_12735, partial [Rhodoglobus sp.]
MSTIDPDARGRAISSVLRPFSRVAAIAALATAPVFAAVLWAGGAVNESLSIALIFTYILLTVAAGILASLVSRTKPGLLVAAYSTAYCGGLFLVMASGLPLSDPGTVPSVIVIGSIYLVAGGLGYLYLLRRAAVGQTTVRGVDTTAEVM